MSVQRTASPIAKNGMVRSVFSTRTKGFRSRGATERDGDDQNKLPTDQPAASARALTNALSGAGSIGVEGTVAKRFAAACEQVAMG